MVYAGIYCIDSDDYPMLRDSMEKLSLNDAALSYEPDQSPALIRACLNGGDILVNGKPADAKVKVTGKDKVLIVFGGDKQCYAAKNRAEYWAEGVQCWYDTNRTMDHDHNHIHNSFNNHHPPARNNILHIKGFYGRNY